VRPGFEPRATLALPTATIGTMAPEASANAMYANRIAQIEDPAERAAYVAARVAEQEAELNLLRMGSEAGRRRRGRTGRAAGRADRPTGRRRRLGADARPAPSRRQPGVTGDAAEAQ